MGCRAIYVTLAACGVLVLGCSSAADDPAMDPTLPPQTMMPIGMGPVGGGVAPGVPMGPPSNSGVPMGPPTTAGVAGGMQPVMMPTAGNAGGDAMMGMAGMAGAMQPQAGSVATAGSGGMGGTMTPPAATHKTPCITKGSQVAVVGDSYIEYTEPLVPRLEAKASAEMQLKQGDHYNNQAVPGSSLAVGLLLIAPQWTSAKRASMNDIKYVIMDGGGNDVLLYNQQCLGDGASQDAGCRKVADDATAVAKMMMEDMKATGVTDVLYFFYPHVPAGGKDLMDNYAAPLAKKNCEENSDANFKCHFVSLVETFEGHANYIQGDGIHPTAAGADAQANLIWGEMKKNCIAQSSGCCMP